MHFLAFEGLDGSGKSTLMNGLKAELTSRSIDYLQTREPGGTPLGDDIRALLLRDDADVPRARTEALLYQAGRAQHVETLIRPALAAGRWVLSDRFAASSVAFQAGGRAISRAQIEWLNTFSTDGLEPDLYVLLDLTVAESARRLQGRAGEGDRIEREAAEFHQRVRDAYLELARATPERWLVLDAAASAGELCANLVAALVGRGWFAH